MFRETFTFDHQNLNNTLLSLSECLKQEQKRKKKEKEAMNILTSD